MLGLSNYSPYREKDDPDYVAAPSSQYYMGMDEVPPEILERMQQRYQDSLGFADLNRTGPDALYHGLAENVPSKLLDDPLQVANEYGAVTSPVTSFRELIELLKNMSPLNSKEMP